MNPSFNPVELNIDYNEDFETLTLRPKSSSPTIRFRDLGIIKFGNSLKDVDMCDVSNYQYSVVKTE